MKQIIFLLTCCFYVFSAFSQNTHLRKTDSIYRTLGKDSIQFSIDGRYHSLKDSTGDTTNILTTHTALIDSIYGKDPYTWQTSIISPLADSALIPAYRQDAPSIATFSNGVKIASWSGFPNGAQIGDNQPSNVVGSRSYNNGLTWAVPTIQVSGAISNMGHVSTPSLYIQPNGNVIMIVNVKNSYAVIPSPKTGTNFYRYLSTDSGFTYVLQDSLIASVTRYAGITNNRIVQSQRTKRLIMPFLEQTTISAHYQVGAFYSDNLGNSWTDFGWRIAQTDSSADEPGAFILQNAAPNDTAGGVEKVYFYWTNSGQVLYAYSQDNGATIHGNYALGLNSTQTVLSIISCQNETQAVGLINRSMVNCCSTQGGQRKFVDLIYSSDGINWKTIGNIAGWDSGYHYFEQAITWDSAHGEFMSAISRMIDNQTRSDIRWYRIPTRTALGGIQNQPVGPVIIGMDNATLTNAQPGLMIYNRTIDNLASNGPNGVSGYTQFNTVSGSTFWPGMVMRATTDGPLGGFLQGWVGTDNNSQYYSAAFDFVGHPHTGTGALTTCPLAKFINNTTVMFKIGPTGDTEISDSVQLDKIRDGTTSDSVAVLKQLSAGKFIIHKVAQSSIGGGGITRISPLDSLAKSANGVQVSGVSLVPQSADGSFPGLITTGAQTIAGVKTFSSTPIFPAPTTSNASIHLTGGSASPTSPTTGDFWYNFSAPGFFFQPLGSSAPINLIPNSEDISTTSLTLDNTYSDILFNGGSAASWTLPAGVTYQTVKYKIKNRGTASITLSRSSTDVIYLGVSPVTSIVINPGDMATVFSTGGGNWAGDISSSTGTPIRYLHSIFTPTTGGTVNLVNNQYNIINPAGALLALTVNLPSSPANNDVVYIKFTQNVTTVTYANGTVVDGITAPSAGGLTVLTYDSGTTSWY